MSLLIPPKAPNLPLAPAEHERQYADQVNNALRLYFNKLDSVLQSILKQAGGANLSFPYGSFSSTATQTAALAQTPTEVALSTVDFANGTTLSSNSVVVANAGLYNMQFSVQVTNADTQAHDIDIYFKKNGQLLANTASVVTVPSTHGGQPGYNILAANFFVEFNAGDVLTMWWVTNSTQVTLNYLPAITSPFISPGAPSVVLTLSFVSALPT